MWSLSSWMWNLVPWPGMKPGPPALRVWSVSHWTTREVPKVEFYIYYAALFFFCLTFFFCLEGLFTSAHRTLLCFFSHCIIFLYGWTVTYLSYLWSETVSSVFYHKQCLGESSCTEIILHICDYINRGKSQKWYWWVKRV